MEQYDLACTDVPRAAKSSIPLSYMFYTLIGMILDDDREEVEHFGKQSP